MLRILVAEDEQAISDLIAMNLATAGYEAIQVRDGAGALTRFREQHFDLVLLDIMLPGPDGYKLLPHIVEKGVPVILVTAKTGLKDRITGLNLGADDYITKPFECVELVARVRAVLRRTGKPEDRRLSFDGLDVYPERRKVMRGDTPIELTSKEFDLLVYLLENRTRALSRETLLRYVWGFEYAGETRTVDMHIRRLRSKLRTDRIETVYRLGYRLE